MKPLFLLPILFLGVNISVFSQKDCPNDCSKQCMIFFTKYDVNARDLKKALRERNKEVYNDLEKIFEEEDYFLAPKYGVGCFFFYSVFAELAASASLEEDPGFIKFLESKTVNIREFQEKGLQAIDYAWKVWEKLANLDHSCKREFEKIGYKEFRDNLTKDSLSILENLWAPNLKIKEFTVDDSIYLSGDLVTFTLVIKNVGKMDFMDAAEIRLIPAVADSARIVSKYIGQLKKDSSVIVKFEHVYDKPGIHNATVVVDPEKGFEERTRGGSKDFAEKEVEVKEKEKDKNIDPVDLGYGLYIVVNSNFQKGSLMAKLVEENFSSENCIHYMNQFPKNIVNTPYSKKQEIRFFKETLLPKFEERNISLETAKITITGFADGHPFTGKGLPLPKGMDDCKGGKFLHLLSNDQQTEKVMEPLDSIRSNQQLAFVRAYHAKLALVKILGIPESLIVLQVMETEQIADQYRGALVEICGNALSLPLLKDIADRANNINNFEGEEENKMIKHQDKEEFADHKPRHFKALDESILKNSKTIKAKDLSFKADSVNIDLSAYGEDLHSLMELAKHNPEAVIVIFTYPLCNDPSCLELTERRAVIVYNHLIQNGITNIIYKGNGNTPQLDFGIKNNERMKIKLMEIRA